MLLFLLSFVISLFPHANAPSAAQTRSTTPRFKDYPVGEIFKGKPANVDWPEDYPQHDFFKLSIQDLVDGGVNFAGHYAVREWSCGTDCRWLVILDLKTGKFFKNPPYGSLSLGYDDPPDRAHDWLQIRPDSRLLIASGCFDVEAPKKPVRCGTKFFKLEKQKFVLLRYDPKPTPTYFK